MTAPGRWAVTGIAAPLGLLAGVVARPSVLALALVPLAGASAVLSLTDQRWCRLPDRVVGPAYLCVTAGLVASAVVADDYAALGRSAAAGAVAAVVYVAIRLIRPSSIGFGDVKLVPMLAMVLGWSGWFDVFLGWALAYASATAVVLVGVYRAELVLKSSLPLGPHFFIGTWVALIVGRVTS